MSETPDMIAQFNKRLDTLERRVFTLEHPSLESPLKPVPAVDTINIPPHQDADTLSFAQASGIVPMLGKALLGIAGAYLLRAIAESGSFPKLAVVVLAITYAGMWLVFAVRVRTMAWYTGITYATTASLILTPMIWELTLRFKFLPASISALVLASFAIAALTLTWKRSLVSVFWVAYGTATFTSLALMIATHDLVPFLGVLLLTLVASEFAACRGHRLNGRILAGVVVDIAVALLLFIYSGPANTRAEYSSISMPVLLALVSIPFLVYAASVTLQTILRRQQISLFEMTQTMITFSLALYGVISFTSGDHSVAIGIACLVLSAAGYAVALTLFDSASVLRNYHTYSAWSAALFLLGSILCLPQMWLSIWLGVAAIAATSIGAQRSRLTLEYHGALYLLAAAFVSGLLRFTAQSLIGSLPTKPAWIFGAIFALSFLCYLLGGRPPKDQGTQRLPHLATAVLTATSGAALLVSVLALFTLHLNSLKTNPLEFIQTLAACSIALALAYSGSRWRRIELSWIAYGALVFVAAKVLFEDLRHGHLGLIAASFFLYAATLILLPRLASRGQPEQSPTAIAP